MLPIMLRTGGLMRYIQVLKQKQIRRRPDAARRDSLGMTTGDAQSNSHRGSATRRVATGGVNPAPTKPIYGNRSFTNDRANYKDNLAELRRAA